MLELRHLRLLRAIADAGTLSGAARELGLTQPAVTQAVQSLERSLETPLFVRVRGGIQLTAAAEVVLRHGDQVLAEVSLCEAEVAALAGLRSGTVRLACFPSAAATILPEALVRMSAEHPGVTFTLTEAEPKRALEMLRRGECDLAIVNAYVREDGAESEAEGMRSSAQSSVEQALPLDPGEAAFTLIDEAQWIALPRGHDAAGEGAVDLARLAGESWIAGCPDCRANLTRASAAAGFSPRIVFETDDYLALQELTAAGLGVALVSDLMLAATHRGPNFELRPVRDLPHRVVRVISTSSLLRVPGVEETILALQGSADSVRAAADALTCEVAPT